MSIFSSERLSDLLVSVGGKITSTPPMEFKRLDRSSVYRELLSTAPAANLEVLRAAPEGAEIHLWDTSVPSAEPEVTYTKKGGCWDVTDPSSGILTWAEDW